MLATYEGIVRDGKPILLAAVTLPENSKIIITILDQDIEKPVEKHKGSAFGCLRKYANPALIPEEKGVWEKAVAEKYANN